MSSSVGSFVCGMRNFIDQGFRSLPTILANCVLLLGLLQGNLTYIFFFIGLFLVTPFITGAINNGLFLLLPKILSRDLLFASKGGAEQCMMFPVFPSAGLGDELFVVPSYWVTIISFFFSYLFYNAYMIYIQEPEKNAPAEAVRRRKYQTASSMFVLAISFVVLMILRYVSSGCETGIGMFVGALLGIFIACGIPMLGYGWYDAMRACGLGQFDDIFGIQTQMVKS